MREDEERVVCRVYDSFASYSYAPTHLSVRRVCVCVREGGRRKERGGGR